MHNGEQNPSNSSNTYNTNQAASTSVVHASSAAILDPSNRPRTDANAFTLSKEYFFKDHLPTTIDSQTPPTNTEQVASPSVVHASSAAILDPRNRPRTNASTFNVPLEYNNAQTETNTSHRNSFSSQNSR